MNRLLILVLALAACADPVRPGDTADCEAAPTSGHDFCQAYVAEDSMPGSPQTIFIRVHDTSIAGNGHDTDEAGPSGSFLISGLLRQPYLDLTLSYQDGLSLQYSGRFAPEGRITGVLVDTAGHTTPLSFVGK
jgi:hypothetical protein